MRARVLLSLFECVSESVANYESELVGKYESE